MAILKDLLLACCLLAALLVVRTFDRLKPATDFPALPATPLSGPAAGATDAPLLPDDTEVPAAPPANGALVPEEQVVDSQGTQPRTGIIDSFEPYPTKLVDEPPPPPPKLVDTPPKLDE